VNARAVLKRQTREAVIGLVQIHRLDQDLADLELMMKKRRYEGMLSANGKPQRKRLLGVMKNAAGKLLRMKIYTKELLNTTLKKLKSKKVAGKMQIFAGR
jgi:hypothetical protein